ncbi:MAG: LysM peptidoglycan-binding domain-containing protein [Candidatus Promineifilaceae bacterium]|nr:LysM peptidoglycan-binding domain-containing protein [Candidatus Promineifilaceae bacterium]
MKRLRTLLLVLLALSALWPAALPAAAQDDAPPTPTPEGPIVHVVQEGENLTIIARQYDVSVQDLLLVNGLDEEDIIQPGQQLTIPGETGEAVATAYTVQVGDTLESLALRFNTTPAEIAAPNNLVSPRSLYAGQTLSVVSKSGSAEPRPITGTLHLVQPGETLLALAARYGLSREQIAATNNLAPPARLYPGMRLRIPPAGDATTDAYHFLPGGWERVFAGPIPMSQGRTMSVYVEHALPGEPRGAFANQTLRFAPHGEGYVALVGLDAFTEPGRYALQLEGMGQQSWWPFSQDVQVTSSNYPTQTINVPAELEPLLDPEIRAEEDAFLSDIYGTFTPEQQWQGPFQLPVTNTVVTAGYGGIRSYNGGPFDIFHTGVDFGGGVGTPIAAPAAGTVVFSNTLELRGNTVIIDHGLGVMSGYYHLSEIAVNVGDRVAPGQVIGYGGNTGLSTGPHLHWELRIMDVPVDGRQWTETAFPLTE